MFSLRILQKKRFISNLFYQKRFRVKKKWARQDKEKEHKQRALEHFDHYHQQTFDQSWPQIRLGLLSHQKYGALVNNYSSKCDQIGLNMIGEGSYDIIKAGIDKHKSISMETSDLDNSDVKRSVLSDLNLTDITESEKIIDSNEKNDVTFSEEDDRTDLYRFVPAEKVYTDDEIFAMEEHQENILVPSGFDVRIIPETNFRLPTQLKVFTQPMGEAALFPSPKTDGDGMLGYYLFDAASVLPVLALNLQPNESVLDLCAAPGGKSLAILQTHLPGLLVCNDISWNRMSPLRSILDSYVPSSLQEEGEVICNKQDARSLKLGIEFDKVLVDVPCLTDRHCLKENDNNIFKPGRIPERMQLTTVQKELLIAGIESCRPGGSIVYSTCTSTMPQNDGVIQAALEHIWENTGMEVVVQDTSILRTLFEDSFKFYDNCRFGQLVLPHIQANFGPMYICKLKRVS